MLKPVKIINVMVFFTWAALIAILLYQNYTEITLERTQILEESFKKQTYWYDIYKGTKKIGFAVTTIQKTGNEVIIKHEREIKVTKEGEETLFIEKLKSLCDSYYSIKSFEYTSNVKGEKGFKVSGEVDAGNIIFLLESPEKRKTYKISTNGRDFYLPITLIPVIHQKTLVSGTPFLIPMLDIVNLSIDDVRVFLEEIRPVKVGIHIRSLYKFRVGDSIIWSNENGIIMKEDNPSGITLYAQLEDIAKTPDDRILFDYASLPFFKSNKLIPDIGKLNLLNVKIEGFRLYPQLYENSLVRLENDILTIEKQDIEELKKRTYTLPYRKDNLNVYLRPDEWVLSDFRPLRDTGRTYARANNHDAFRFARYLNGYLYTLIRTMPFFMLSDSEGILRSLYGDYLERTIMFASYSRAAGLPTRLVGGLVYLNGYFYFHTWPEVWFDRWVPLDPTFVQFPADVTHIPLRSGTAEEIASIVKDLKNIKITVLEAS